MAYLIMGIFLTSFVENYKNKQNKIGKIKKYIIFSTQKLDWN